MAPTDIDESALWNTFKGGANSESSGVLGEYGDDAYETKQD
jgi:hypothetical protein